MKTFKKIPMRLVSQARLDEAEAAIAKLARIEEREQYLRERLRLSSESISTSEIEYKFVHLGEDFSADDIEDARQELAVAYEFEFGTREGMEEAISTAVMGGEIVLRFRGSRSYSASGTSWNEQVYPNIVRTADVRAGKVDVKGNPIPQQ